MATDAKLYFEGVALPKQGQIALAGEIESIDISKRQLTLLVQAFQVASGNAKTLALLKKRAIQLPAAFDLTTLLAGDEIVVQGQEMSVTQPFAAQKID